MFKWITHKSFGANLLAVIILFVVVGIVFFSSLRYLTHHGETRQVPGVVGQAMAAAETELRSHNFEVIVQDSAFVDSLPPLAVVRQTPDPGSVVKTERTIYLTLNKTAPPLTAMPNLVNYSFRSAEMTLESQRLQVGDTLYKPDIAKDAVLEQLYQGKRVEPGQLIPEGSKITLVLGDGLGNTANPVPSLVGLTYQQALDLLSASALNSGVVLTQGPLTDTLNAYVTRQNPAPAEAGGQPNYIRAGESIDMWVSQTLPSDSTQPAAP